MSVIGASPRRAKPQDPAVLVREKTSPLKTRSGVVHADVTPAKFPAEVKQGKSPSQNKGKSSPGSQNKATLQKIAAEKSPRSKKFEQNL